MAEFKLLRKICRTKRHNRLLIQTPTYYIPLPVAEILALSGVVAATHGARVLGHAVQVVHSGVRVIRRQTTLHILTQVQPLNGEFNQVFNFVTRK